MAAWWVRLTVDRADHRTARGSTRSSRVDRSAREIMIIPHHPAHPQLMAARDATGKTRFDVVAIGRSAVSTPRRLRPDRFQEAHSWHESDDEETTSRPAYWNPAEVAGWVRGRRSGGRGRCCRAGRGRANAAGVPVAGVPAHACSRRYRSRADGAYLDRGRQAMGGRLYPRGEELHRAIRYGVVTLNA